MGYYSNALRGLMENPASFTNQPGYKARMDAIMQAAQRANSGSIGSGNYGYAMEDAASKGVNEAYGNEFERLSHAAELEQRGEISGAEIAQRGKEAEGNLGLGFYRAGNDYDIAGRTADETGRRDWYDYSLGRDRNNITASGAQNQFNVDAYNAFTNRGRARSQDWLGGEELNLKRPRNVIGFGGSSFASPEQEAAANEGRRRRSEGYY